MAGAAYGGSGGAGGAGASFDDAVATGETAPASAGCDIARPELARAGLDRRAEGGGGGVDPGGLREGGGGRGGGGSGGGGFGMVDTWWMSGNLGPG